MRCDDTRRISVFYCPAALQTNRLPPKPNSFTRDFFLYVVGWDKDADFHVGHGWSVEPLPFRGMDDQTYGRPTNASKRSAAPFHSASLVTSRRRKIAAPAG